MQIPNGWITATTVAVHPSPAHPDETLSLPLVLAICENVERVIHTNSPRTDDPTIICLDVGGQLSEMVVDHHQKSEEVENECTFSLLLKRLGLWEQALSLWDWLPRLVMQDAKGPGAAASMLGITHSQYFACFSPIEAGFIDLVSRHEIIEREDPLFRILKEMGTSLLNSLASWGTICQQVADMPLQDGFLWGLDVSQEDAVRDSRLYNLALKRRAESDPTILGSVMWGSRPPGSVTLFSFNTERMNLHTILSEEDESVLFIHKNGFMGTVTRSHPFLN